MSSLVILYQSSSPLKPSFLPNLSKKLLWCLTLCTSKIHSFFMSCSTCILFLKYCLISLREASCGGKVKTIKYMEDNKPFYFASAYVEWIKSGKKKATTRLVRSSNPTEEQLMEQTFR